MKKYDEIFDFIIEEDSRQRNTIELIASENFVSRNVLKAQGSILTNKYAEGYPEKRYYGGCEIVDKIESLAIERLKKLFNVKYANVQPHSGSQANQAAIMALINPGEKILGMSLSSGGHLTHGYKVNFSGKIYEGHSYDVDENGFIDYEHVRKRALEVKPQLIICGFSAYPREYDFSRFKKIADEVGAYLLADIAHVAGIIAVGMHNSPVGHAHIITSTTHKTLRGARGGIIMTNDEKIAKKIDSAIFPGIQGGPLVHQIAGKAVAFKEALEPEFKKYIKNVLDNNNAFFSEFKKLGSKIITGGSDNHLFTIDVKSAYGITGKKATAILEKVNIIANKNTIPFDKESPVVTSGVRLGTAAMTTRGFDQDAFIETARIMDSVWRDDSEENIEKSKLKVEELITKYSGTLKESLKDLNNIIKKIIK
ncbi:MAG: serine hydroxymethyltransferase [Mycoplasma sp.]|nr:serine hydroxymethyltransferase [Mycoplasma sp.]